MTHKILFASVLAILAVGAEVANAQAASFTMQLPRPDEKAQPLVIGGVKADPDNWPMTFVFLDPSGGGCTSTGVGATTIITAAHCIPNGATGIVEVGGRKISASCSHHPDYRSFPNLTPANEGVVSPDFALCKLTEAMPPGLFENVDTQGLSIFPDANVHLLGYGCTKEGGRDKGFGVLYEGDSKIISVPSTPSYYTRTRGGAAVCFGDSGGGAYQYLTPDGSRRHLIGINSRGDISTISFISTAKEKGFREWALKWAESNNAQICGIHGGDNGCRPH